LKQYAYIEWLSFIIPDVADEALDGNDNTVDTNPFSMAQYRWLLTDDTVDIDDAQYGASEDLLAWLSAVDCSLVFIVPGEKIVVRQVPYHDREKRHFAKMLPYEVEDSVIEDVENLHFVIGEKTDKQATIAYIDKAWFEQAVIFFQSNNKPIERSFIDFQCLQRQKNETVVWFDQSRLLTHAEAGVGFSTSDRLVDAFLHDLLTHESATDNSQQVNESDHQEKEIKNNPTAACYKVYVTNTHDVGQSNASGSHDKIDSMTRVFHTLQPEIESSFYAQAPILSLTNPHAINFCSGVYAPKSNNASWFSSWQWVGVLALVTILLFVSSNFVDIFLTQQKISQQTQQIEALVREVIPEGVVRDPIRSLTNRLADVAGGDQSSQVVRMLAYVAPVIQSLDIELLTINYMHKEQTLRLSVQANSFNMVEQLRTNIEAKGLTAELLSSNAIDNKFQARLRIRMENQ
jgi:general secretion pathway protein L